MNVVSTVVGYPYIGAKREWKKTLERFWKKELLEDEFEATLKQLRINRLKHQQNLGLEYITIGDFTKYDRMLDLAVMFNIIPKRYEVLKNPTQNELYYAMARGAKEVVACEMTKWFNTNYHYIVPEYEGQKLALQGNSILDQFLEARDELGILAKPTIIGPYTFLDLAKGYDEKTKALFVLQIIPLYAQVIQELTDAGAEWIQLEEPSFTKNLPLEEVQLIEEIYKQLREQVPTVKIIVQTYFEAVSSYERIIQLPVDGFGLDFVHGGKQNLTSIQSHGFPKEKLLSIGVINGRDIWSVNLAEAVPTISTIKQLAQVEEIWVSSSCSLQHVPVSKAVEGKLPQELFNHLAFADEKIREIAHITHYIQKDALSLPDYPTTTIGSFPQSAQVKKMRSAWRKGELTDVQYAQFVKEETARWIQIQEEIGLDVLVHGEFERNDMVEYFGEHFTGFAFTDYAWVVSYGSRCVKPPIIYGDVEWTHEMTVKEVVEAQALTDKYVKGMLTGPVTILNWSFVRNDISHERVALQIGYALRQEVIALEKAGIQIIQVDEPALREGLPLRKENWSDYLNWAVNAFKLATSNVATETQIHTHMCYCEFNDFIDPIRALDADVISLETSRSHGELIHSLKENPYELGVGLGVYDIHSPRVPSVDEMSTILHESLAVISKEQFWVNPDCGLKTRQEAETVASLKNMVVAAKKLRQQVVSI